MEIHDYHYFVFYGHEADANGGLADFCKYKENVFCPAFFWIIVILTESVIGKIKKLYWILTQALVFMVFLDYVPFYAIFIELKSSGLYILPLLYLYSIILCGKRKVISKIKQINSVDNTIKNKNHGDRKNYQTLRYHLFYLF